MERYFIVETRNRVSDIDFVQKVCYGWANALNYFYTRLAAMVVVSDTYTDFHISILDANMEIVVNPNGEVMHKDVNTLYEPTTEATTAE